MESHVETKCEIRRSDTDGWKLETLELIFRKTGLQWQEHVHITDNCKVYRNTQCLGVWESAVSSPSGVWGGAPAEIEFRAF